MPEPPQPQLLTRTDGHAIFYAGRVNAVFGDPESGKTWVCLVCAVEALRARRRVLFVDLDHNTAGAVVPNLLMLGASASVLCDRDLFRYCEPEDATQLRRVVEECTDWRPAVAVVDSIGELMPLFGWSSNSADDFTLAHAAVLKPLATAGAAVLGVDHLAKNPDSRVHGPGGTAAKRRAVGGASIRVKPLRQFVPGEGGSALLIVNKDRHGGLRRHCPTGDREPQAGTFVLDRPDGNGAVGWRVLPPLELAGAAAGLDDKTREYLAVACELDADTFSARDLAAAWPGADDPPTTAQRDQAAYHAERLADAGRLEVAKPGHRGRGGAARWRVSEADGKSEIKSERPSDQQNRNANRNKSEGA